MKIEKTLIRGSILLLISFGIFNFFNFVFQVYMARNLSVSDFGILSTLFSIIYIFGILTESVQLIVTKYTSGETNKGKIKNIMNRSIKKSAKTASVLFIIYVFISIFISKTLKIGYPLLLMTGIMLFGSLLIPVTRGIMQGEKRFLALGSNMVSESSIKLFLSVLFIFLGYGVFGAIFGTVSGVFFSFALSFISLKDILKAKEEEKKIIKNEVSNQTYSAFFIMLSVFIFYSMDIIIAKAMFPSEVAGEYAIASILAKIIFLGTQPISRAMFPIATDKIVAKKDKKNIFYNALSILLAISIISLCIIYFLSDKIIFLFSGKSLFLAIKIFLYIAIAISILSISNLVLLYRFSRGTIKNSYYLLIFIMIEFFLLCYFSSNLQEFTIAFITSATIFLWGASSAVH